MSSSWPSRRPPGPHRCRRVTQALADLKPDAIFNVLFGADLSKFVREGNTRGLFKDRAVVSLLTGEPEYLDPLRDEAPDGWIVTGYPWYSLKTAEHDRRSCWPTSPLEGISAPGFDRRLQRR
jgi:branched-chain amino acid transport system substrate-binding protein